MNRRYVNMTQKKATIYYEEESHVDERTMHLKLEELGIGVLTVDIEDVETVNAELSTLLIDVMKDQDPRWKEFMYNCIAAGKALKLNDSQIDEYICETYHSMTIDSGEVPLTIEDITTDMKLYFSEQ